MQTYSQTRDHSKPVIFWPTRQTNKWGLFLKDRKRYVCERNFTVGLSGVRGRVLVGLAAGVTVVAVVAAAAA